MRQGKVKEVGLDIVADIIGSFFIAVGVYNFFPNKKHLRIIQI